MLFKKNKNYMEMKSGYNIKLFLFFKKNVFTFDNKIQYKILTIK